MILSDFNRHPCLSQEPLILGHIQQDYFLILPAILKSEEDSLIWSYVEEVEVQ